MIQKQKNALCTLAAALLLATVAAGCSAGSQSNPAPAPVADKPAQSVAAAQLPAAPAAEVSAPAAEESAPAAKGTGPAAKAPAAEAAAPAEQTAPAPFANVEIAEITDDRLAQYPAYDEVDVASDDYGFKVILTTDQTVQNLKLTRLTWDDATQEIVKAYDGALYDQEELTADRPLVIKLSIPGTMPTVGVEYTEPDGSIATYHIIMSGEDGSMQLSPVSAG